MADKIKLWLRLMKLYARMDLNWFLQDFKMCGIVMVTEFLMTISSVMGVFLLAMRFRGVGTMSEMEVLFMLGFYTFGGGLLYMFGCGFNVHQISRRIGRGQIDHMLIQPIPLWAQLATEGFLPVTGSSGLISGIGIMAYATLRLALPVTPQWIGQILLLGLCSFAIEMGLSYLLASSAFYRPVACEEISSVGHDLLMILGKYPLSGLPEPLIAALCTVLPAGLMAWVPSLILLRKAPAGMSMLLPLGVAAALIALAQFAFRRGMRHYLKNSCNRYRDMGYRS